MSIRSRRLAQRIERLEVETQTHDIFRTSYVCVCSRDVTAVVRRAAVWRGQVAPSVNVMCPEGHRIEVEV